MIKLTASAMMDVGKVREVNEDNAWAFVNYIDKTPIGLFVVCDGMGGHMGGEFASYWAVETIKKELSDLFATDDPRATVLLSRKAAELSRTRARTSVGKVDQDAPTKPSRSLETTDIEERVRSAIQKANHVVFEYAKRKPDRAANAGTTISMALVRGNQAVIANVGDSRTYLLRNHRLRQITQDHSLVANMVSSGQILPDEVYTHPQRNVIYRFLGQKGMVQMDVFHEVLRPGDYLLLCSDGLWEMVQSENDIVHIIQESPNVETACQALAESANNAGGEDNIGVVVAKISRGLRHRLEDYQGVMW